MSKERTSKRGHPTSYRTRQAESFAFVGTNSEEWRACEITQMNQATGEITEYDAPPGYRVVTPISSRLPQDQLAELMDKLAASEYGTTLCELCGAVVRYPQPIAHDGKKLVMYIGSECVKNYTKAGKQYKQLKKAFKDNRLKEKFKLWAPIAIADIWILGEEDDGSNLLKYPYYRLKVTIEKTSGMLDDLSGTKIRNIFKKARALGVSAPTE